MKKTYTLELFDSRNTSFESPLHHATTRIEAANQAIRASKSGKYHHVVLHEVAGRAWVEYENGQKVSWSA